MSPPPLSDRILRLAKHPQFAWFIGHLLSVLGLPLYALFTSTTAYYRALLGAIIAYGVVLYRHYKLTIFTHGLTPTCRRLLVDLNAHYFALAFYFWLSGYPCLALLVPYASFSLFHCLGYIKDVLFPALFSNTTSSTSSRSTFPPIITKLSERAGSFSATYQPQALQLASYWEITITPAYLLLQVFTWRQSLLAPIVYAQFVAVRYLTSATTRSAAGNVRRYLDSKLEPFASRTDALRNVGLAYIAIRDRVSMYLNTRMATSSGSTSTPPQSSSSTTSSSSSSSR